MMNKLKILFATDFSSNSKSALRLLKRLKKYYQIDCYFTHIILSFWKDWIASGELKENVLQRLQSWQHELIGKADLKKLYVNYGNAAEIILKKANTIKADLIVLGSKSDKKESRYNTGTTAEAIVRHAKKSVLLSKNDNITKILCGIDGSKSSAKALQHAISLCQQFSASLCIVSALRHDDLTPLGMSKAMIKKHEEIYKHAQIKQLTRFLNNFDFSGMHFETYFSWGSPASAILDMAEDNDYDLIVIGAKGHSALHHILIGSTAEKILRYTPCSLLVVR